MNRRAAGTVAHWMGVYDDKNRLMVMISFNSDYRRFVGVGGRPAISGENGGVGDSDRRRLRGLFDDAIEGAHGAE